MKWVRSNYGMRNAECGSPAIRNPKSAIRNLLLVLLMTLGSSPISFAQETNNPEEIKKNLADALNQLKAAQDRKNELSNENEGLKNRIAELEKQLNEQKQKTAELEDKTWFWRSHYFAWMRFIERYPKLLAEWKVFMETNPLETPSLLPVWSEALDAATTPGVNSAKLNGE